MTPQTDPRSSPRPQTARENEAPSDRQEIDIGYVARLARIELTDEERERYKAQLGDILRYFHHLDAVEVEGVEPTSHAYPMQNVWRRDDPSPALPVEEALRHAPAQRDQQFVVPKVIEDS